ncbi:Glutathione S-transferase [Colletotrichum siamense]|uniref:Glutathione S-transferase n=1 Tax=Colletotrichum siamense TaxID=690259 RepID=A0A9P5EXY6_COLSI|nr:Glutathione S-transferase [Colletotrichum siamense]KAF4861869.1 Glutathione S-transferase [Colletotrichum siamense]
MPTPKITLYRTNGACSLVPHSILTHFAIPFRAVEMEPTPDGTSGIGGRYRAADGSLTHEEYRRINPTGYVPCLIVDETVITEMPDGRVDKTVITEMPAVLTYIASLVPEQNLFGRTAVQRAKAYEWVCWLSGTLHSLGYAGVLRPERFVKGEEAKFEVVARGQKIIDECYARIDERLAGREFAVGEGLTVVDFDVYIFYRWGCQFGTEMGRLYPNYERIARMVEGLDGVTKVVHVEKQQLVFHK